MPRTVLLLNVLLPAAMLLAMPVAFHKDYFFVAALLGVGGIFAWFIGVAEVWPYNRELAWTMMVVAALFFFTFWAGA
jgi:hypothetical protein